MSAGKGDKPRNNSSKEFRDNYEKINWNASKNTKTRQVHLRRGEEHIHDNRQGWERGKAE